SELRDQDRRQTAAPGAEGAAAARRRAQLAELPLGPRDLLLRRRDRDDPGRPPRRARLRPRGRARRRASLPGDALPLRRRRRRGAGDGARRARAAAARGSAAAAAGGAMKVGIVGLPNAGKSTLFNALTSGGAQIGNYPFTTIEPNVAVAQVPDERLEQVGETVRSSELVP